MNNLLYHNGILEFSIIIGLNLEARIWYDPLREIILLCVRACVYSSFIMDLPLIIIIIIFWMLWTLYYLSIATISHWKRGMTSC